MNGNSAINGATIAAQPATVDQMIRANLKLHRATFARLDAAFHLSRAVEEAAAAAKLLASGSNTPADYLNFLKQHTPVMAETVADLIRSQKSADPFAENQAVKVLASAVASQQADLSASAHASLLNKLDAFQTMLQKAQGDPADILQMVLWQRRLYSTAPELTHLKVARHVVEESDAFIRAYGRPKAQGDNYAELLRELHNSFHDTAEALEKQDRRLEAAADEIKEHYGSPAGLEKAHRAYLMELQRVVK